MVEKRSEKLTIQEAYSMFNSEKIASGMRKDAYYYELRLMCQRLDISLDCNLGHLGKQTIERYIFYLRDTNHSPGSINHDLRSIRVFLYWCMRNNYIENFKISLVKAQETMPKHLTREELNVILKCPNKDNFTDHRDYLMICFILATGARRSTLLNITYEDLDLKAGTVIFRHLKNKRVATIPLSNQIVKMLQEYINKWNTNSKYLFCSVTSEQLTPDTVSRVIHNYCKARGIEGKGPHSFRHTFAREWILNGGNAFTLQSMLTHSDITMTRKYVRVFAEDIKDSNFDNYVPLDNLRRNSTRTKNIHLLKN